MFSAKCSCCNQFDWISFIFKILLSVPIEIPILIFSYDDTRHINHTWSITIHLIPWYRHHFFSLSIQNFNIFFSLKFSCNDQTELLQDPYFLLVRKYGSCCYFFFTSKNKFAKNTIFLPIFSSSNNKEF